MSVQFGRWNFDGKPVDRDYLEKARASIAPYGPDDAGSYLKENISILYYAFHTTKESRRETQPHITASGAVVTWDGRLDNRAELIRQLPNAPTIGSTDVSIAAAAYEQWGTDCFAKLIGDWALSIWDTNARSLILAKDPIGTRHLYYSFDNNQVTWSSILDPLVLFAGRTFNLEEEYIAGWLSFFPAAHLTPYIGIHSVPPACFVLVEPGRQTISKYWDFDPSKRIRYRIDGEYEEHFRTVFAESVRRRLRSDSPVLAELSGGMDSSSIVCMADQLLSSGLAETPRLDTLSYYDDSEPNWNELPYISKVEQQRGRTGYHIRLEQQEYFRFSSEKDDIAVTPASVRRVSTANHQLSDCLASSGSQVMLSGIGGDEVMGGVPTPLPELADLIAGARLPQLAERLKAWALAKRVPWVRLLLEAVRAFLPFGFFSMLDYNCPPFWLDPGFLRSHRFALRGYERRLAFFGSRPSFQESLSTIDGLRRQLACSRMTSRPSYEVRYPFLDRELLEFLVALPREQLVRPGQRRSLMRRALVGVVPREILDRKRKAYVVRGPMTAVSAEWGGLVDLCRDMICGSLGMILPEEFERALNLARQGHEVPLAPFLRTIAIETWLRTIARAGFFVGMLPPPSPTSISPMPTPVSAETDRC